MLAASRPSLDLQVTDMHSRDRSIPRGFPEALHNPTCAPAPAALPAPPSPSQLIPSPMHSRLAS